MQANTTLSVRLDMCTITFSLRKDSIGSNNMYQTQSGQDTSSRSDVGQYTILEATYRSAYFQTEFSLLCTGIPRYTRSHFTRFRYNAI